MTHVFGGIEDVADPRIFCLGPLKKAVPRYEFQGAIIVRNIGKLPIKPDAPQRRRRLNSSAFTDDVATCAAQNQCVAPRRIGTVFEPIPIETTKPI